MKSTFLLFVSMVMLFACTDTDSRDAQLDLEAEGELKESLNRGMPPTPPRTAIIPIELSGIAHNRKGGAVLHTDSMDYWMENMDSWKENFLDQRVEVMADVIVRDDNPVVLSSDDEISQGIPVDSQADLEAQKSRMWLINYAYHLEIE